MIIKEFNHNFKYRCYSLFLIVNFIPLFFIGQVPNGCFIPTTGTIYTTTPFPSHHAIADFNNDGNRDIVIANWSATSQVSLLMGNGLGSFAAPVVFTLALNAHDVSAGDFNLDGNADIAVSIAYPDTLCVMLGDGTGGFTPAASYYAPSPANIINLDLNSDGNLDLLVSSFFYGTFTQLMGSTSGTFATSTTYSVGSNITHLTKGYFNADSYIDVAVATVNDEVKIFLGNSTNTLSPSASYTLAGDIFQIAPADYNNDSKTDLAVNLVNAGYVQILTGNGNGTFVQTATLSGIAFNSRGMCSADFNSDGNMDVAVSSSFGQVSVFYGYGNGNFSPSSNLLAGAGSYDIKTGDFNNDGLPDLSTANYIVSSVSIFLNAPAPALTVNVQGNNLCAGVGATLTASGANSYYWNNAATTNSTIVYPSANSNYTVVGSAANGCTNSAIANVSVTPGPVISVNSGSICSGNSFTIIPSGAASYTFINGSGLVSPTTTTSYSISGTSSLGCVSQSFAVATVSVYSIPLISVNSGTICSGKNFTIMPVGATIYSISGGSNIVSPVISSNYTVIGYNSSCASSNTVISSVLVSANPTLSVSNGSICPAQSFTLNAAGANSYTYSSITPVVNPTVTTSYSVTGTGTNGCVSPTFAVITVSILPTPTISVNSGAICAGDSFTLIPTGAVSYTFSSGSAIITPSVTSSYSVTGQNTFGCLSPSTAISNVTVLPLPVIIISSLSPSICAGQTTSLTSSGLSTYTWSNGSNASFIAITPSITTSYTLSGTNINGCTSSSVITQAVQICTDIKLNEKVNDLFTIYPNPSTGNFLLYSNEREKKEIIIYNILNEIILSKEIYNGSNSIDISIQPSGLYFIKSKDTLNVKSFKIIKN